MSWHRAWALAAFALAASGAGAQDRFAPEPRVVDDESSIRQRFEDEFRSPGMRVGTFVMRSILAQEIGYDDNVFATTNKRADFASITGAGSALRSDWNQHQVYVSGNAAGLAWAEFTDENAWIGNVATGGRVDVTRDLKVGFDASAARRIDARGDPDSISGAAQPVLYDLYQIAPYALATTGRFTHYLGVQGITTTYFNASSSTGAPINLAALEYNQISGVYRLGYSYLDPHEVFLRLNGLDRNSTNNAGISNQNFSVLSASAGASLRLTPVISAIVEAGMQHVTNDNIQIGGADVPTFDVRVAWEPMNSLRLEARVQREFVSSVVTGALENSPGYVRLLGILSAVSEIRHGLIGTVGAYVLNRSYIDTSSEQQVIGFNLGLRYAVGDGVFLGADYFYRYETDDSDYLYSRNIVITRITKTF